jgi:hypothetical protein
MKKIVFAVLLIVLIGCGTKKQIPDVSKVQVTLSIQHFEQDFFAMDTTQIDTSIQQLFNKYPVFMVDFLQNILASNPQPDSIMQNVKLFTSAYHNVYIASQQTFGNFNDVENEIKQGFKFVKHYFPNYKLPTQLVTYIGPWDAMFMLSNNANGSGIMRDENILGIGLQLSMGSNFPVYQDGAIQALYPAFISKKFDKKYIASNALNVIIDDLYNARTLGKPLVEQMIEAGKRLYLLDAFLPNTPDSIKTGYTQAQLNGCIKNEANIWNFFITNDLLFVNEPTIIKDYMTEAPNTPALGNESPGFIGKFVGWQIVKKWMQKNEKKSLNDLLNTSSKEIFETSKYKP